MKHDEEDTEESPKFPLLDKVALVTGGSRGIGRAIALAFADAGAHVAICARELPDLEATAREIKARNRKSVAVVCDVAKSDDLENLIRTVRGEFERLDILVNNAGRNAYRGPLIDAEERAWDETMNVNVKGPFMLSQLAVRIMREQSGGSIINMASIAGIKITNLHIYGVSKAALIMLTQTMAKEWGQYGIRVNAIAPGIVVTKRTERLWRDPAQRTAIEEGTALGKISLPEDVASAALFLASEASRFVTGTTIVVDGGRMVGPPPVWSSST
jgi:NAD(P)-dependent dehydrogenase (short-subunit alcohol dehydrogenase family)